MVQREEYEVHEARASNSIFDRLQRCLDSCGVSKERSGRCKQDWRITKENQLDLDWLHVAGSVACGVTGLRHVELVYAVQRVGGACRSVGWRGCFLLRVWMCCGAWFVCWRQRKGEGKEGERGEGVI